MKLRPVKISPELMFETSRAGLGQPFYKSQLTGWTKLTYDQMHLKTTVKAGPVLGDFVGGLMGGGAWMILRSIEHNAFLFSVKDS